MIKNNEWIKGIGLVLMFLLGWVASNLFSAIDCGDCDYRQKGLERRLEQMEPYKNRYDMMREKPNPQQQRERRDEYRRNRQERNEEVQPIGGDLV